MEEIENKEEKKSQLRNPLIHGYLEDEIIEYCERAGDEIKKIRKESDRPLVPAELFAASEFLMSFRSWLTNHIMMAEARYRDKVKEFQNAGSSSAASDQNGKATEEYRAYKYLVRVDDLALDQINLVKKFSGYLQEELKGSGGF